VFSGCNVTLEGTVAAVVLLLESVTVAPPAGAGPLSVMCRSRNSAVTLLGFSESDEERQTRQLRKIARNPGPRAGSFAKTATNFEGEII